MKCQMKECQAEATAALALNVPAKGCPVAEHEPIRVVIGLQLCDAHLTTSKAEDFFGADSRLEQIIRIQAQGRAEPDFKRAFVSACAFDSDEWKALTKGKP